MRPNGSTRYPSSSAKIVEDLEAPIESVLWDDDEDVVTGASNSTSSAPLRGARTETSASEGDSDGGDLGGSVTRSRSDKGKSRLA